VADRGTIFLIGGINDVLVVTRSWRWGFARAGLPHALETFRWQQGLWATMTFADLWRTAHHRREADRLAALIRAVRSERPGGPVHVVAHSAGTAITAYALEQLDPADAVTSAVLVGSGLSPGYDLSRAIGRTRCGILAVESWFDAFFLGVGTALLGTADRRWTPAAGMLGFRPPSDPQQAARFHALRWNPRHLSQGWLGGHLSIASPWFVRHTLTAWVRQAEASASGGGTSGSGLRENTHSSTT
jgi:pimeloyl-ACP methyl ester carboxylesterase